jgi:hypothetical protein
MVVACLALFIALGGSAFAALGRNTVGSKQIKNDSVLGIDVRESSLAKVPSAATADSATNATLLGGNPASAFASSVMEPIHRVGAPGQPAFQNNWGNEEGGSSEKFASNAKGPGCRQAGRQ